MKNTSKQFLAVALALSAGLSMNAQAANPDEVVVSRDKVELGRMVGHARVIDSDSSQKNVRVEIFRSGMTQSFITTCADIEANKARSDRASPSDKLAEAARQFDSYGFKVTFDDSQGSVDRTEGLKRARDVAAEKFVRTSNQLLSAAVNLCQGKPAPQ